MAELEDKMLKDEENYGGFKPGDPDDDTFLLTDAEKYPGKLDEFMFISPDKYKEGVELGVIERASVDLTKASDQPDEIPEMNSFAESNRSELESLIEKPASGSVWDAFDSEEAELLDILPGTKTTAKPFEVSSPASYGQPVDINETESEFAPDWESEERFKADVVKQEPAKQESEELNDLKNFLQGELTKSRSGKTAKDSSEKKEKLPVQAAEPIPDEALKSAKTIDLSKFELDKPSKLGQVNASVQPVMEDDSNIFSNEYSDLIGLKQTIGGSYKAQAIPDDELREKKKSKKRISILAAALLLFAFSAVGAAGYLVYKNNIDPVKMVSGLFSGKAQETVNSKNNIAKHETPAETKPEAKPITKSDSAKASGEAQKPAGADTNALVTKNAEKISEPPKTEPEHKTAEIKAADNAAAAPSKIINDKVTGNKKLAIDKQSEVAETHQKKLEAPHKRNIKEWTDKNENVSATGLKKALTNDQIAKKNLAEKKSVKVKPEDTKNNDLASVLKPETKLMPDVKNVDEINAVYTVQIYASPSESDAKEWLNSLKSKNIENAFISPQKIRDQVWYRVRFGSFNSREEARRAALRLGFSQTWIDRVK